LSRNESVDVLRSKIDQIDEKLLELLNERASVAVDIGHHKRLNNQEIYVPGREKQVVDRLAQLNRGPLSEAAIRSVFRQVIGSCRSLESPLKIAFFGVEASYSHLAARERFGATATFVPTTTISEVFQEVTQRRADYGVVPVENSTEGVVAHTLDLLVDSDLQICAELFLDIHHYLLSRSGRKEEIRKIVSHAQALAQCRQWLALHLPAVQVEPVASTAHAALLAAQDDTLAAVASSLAGEIYGLELVAANIEDQSNNITRFLVIGYTDSNPGIKDKTSLVFSVKDEPGILYRMLEPFAASSINLSKIESRPIKNKPWEYMFFLDLKGHKEEPRVKQAIEQLKRTSVFLKVLGSYPSEV